MKKIIYVLICFSLNVAVAQTTYGLKGGINLTFFNENQEQFGVTPDAEVGYFGGFLIDFKFTETFHIQPELLFKGVGDFQFINAPIYAEYYVAKDVSILLGPSLNYFFEIFTNKFKVRADISGAYHLTEVLEFNLKYTLGFKELSPNVLFLGMGFSL